TYFFMHGRAKTTKLELSCSPILRDNTLRRSSFRSFFLQALMQLTRLHVGGESNQEATSFRWFCSAAQHIRIDSLPQSSSLEVERMNGRWLNFRRLRVRLSPMA